jgi:hypothetical protein
LVDFPVARQRRDRWGHQPYIAQMSVGEVARRA